ncbi:MAG: acetyl-CoA carboxylase carboxyltransferase subunit alpha [Deltaproteobacteria bacterium]|nr:acetyl-CoA carboxylase carboxyltransferase subunit alpha [Deltaproteobacteria bacterium]
MFIYDFEKPIYEIERRIDDLKKLAGKKGMDISKEIRMLEKKKDELIKEKFSHLSIEEVVKIARHPSRPYTLDYIERIAVDFIELHGDRRFADDRAMVTGLAKIDDFKVAIIGHQKGKNTKENLRRNFGMAHPEGYRKALRVMKLAEKFKLSVVTLIDTPGAYPGVGAEERGQAEAIATNLYEMAGLRVPIVVVVTGEGGSGGALGIGVGDKVGMLSHAFYSVISPEGCSSILWRDAEHTKEAAKAMRITARDLYEVGVIDEIIEEPVGGAHRNYDEMARRVKAFIVKTLSELVPLTEEEILENRWKKIRKMTTQFL